MKLVPKLSEKSIKRRMALAASSVLTVAAAAAILVPIHIRHKHSQTQLSQARREAVMAAQTKPDYTAKLIADHKVLMSPFNLIETLKKTDNNFRIGNLQQEFFINLMSTLSGQDVSRFLPQERVNLANQLFDIKKINEFAAQNGPYFTKVTTGTQYIDVAQRLDYKPGEMFAAQLTENLARNADPARAGFVQAILPKINPQTAFGSKLVNDLSRLLSQREARRPVVPVTSRQHKAG